MKYKLVVDSCCDLTKEMKSWSDFDVVPLTLQIGDYKILDDENFQQEDFIKRMLAYDGIAKSACPSPDAFAKAYEGDYDCVFVVTVTGKLSGTYNSAMQGKNIYEEDHEGDGKKIHVFNSRATSGLETLMALKIKGMADSGKSFEEIVEEVEDYCINHTELYFCLENMDALKGNGRLFNLAAHVIEALRVKLICKRTTEGNIDMAGKDLSITRALGKIVGKISDDTKNSLLTDKTCIITHVCAEERANLVANKVRELGVFKNVIILKCSGLNSLYASNGGIIVSFDK